MQRGALGTELWYGLYGGGGLTAPRACWMAWGLCICVKAVWGLGVWCGGRH